MVYCGKPSKGCQMCRTRRIKCDETKPTCTQCTKSRRQCPGYKDEFDLIFRNETQATERRARKASKKGLAISTGKPDSTPRDMKVSLVFGNTAIPSIKQAVIRPLNIPIEQQASCSFVSNFILMPGEGSGRAFMDFIIPLLKEHPQGHLQNAFNACSIAFLNNRGGVCNRFSDRALYEYTKALNGTNAALRNPKTQLADTTLAAVLLLGLFESITAKQIGMLNWGSHTEGAIQLVKARGKKQLKTKIGLGLFIAVRTQMIIHSLTAGTTPIMGAEWWIDDAIRDKTAASCHRLMIKLGECRAEVTRLMNSMARTPSNIEIMTDMLRRIQTVDQEVVAWMRNVPEEWRFRTVTWEDHVPNGDYSKAEVFPGRVDVYHDFWITSVWNTSRTARLVLASLVVRCAAWICSPVDYRTTPEYATAARTCVETITDIIASVPYQLGWRPGDKNGRQQYYTPPSLLSPPSSLSLSPVSSPSFPSSHYQPHYQPPNQPPNQTPQNGFPCGSESSPKALAGYFLTWPLICLHSQDYTTDAQRAWIHGRLRFIGDELGVKYAHVLRQLRIRMPSMLIRRDALMAKQASGARAQQDYLRVVVGRSQGQGQMGVSLSADVCLRSASFAPPLPPGLSAGAFVGQAALRESCGSGSGGDNGGVDEGEGDDESGLNNGNDGPLQYIEALRKKHFEQHRAELLAHAAGGQDAGESQKWVAQRWLVV
ncbi:hypothetical protein GL218_09141 [Daldinia childiae]|uniref:uncharacterized protein n=1 Tax=Daldinia childiae TaxID=326645 RepID=UPI001446E968|nr:uncharacterized protein GL218_09141 [Daldinia childiae]KAF3066335.1 hypothetical protein GL218_09141 [Daldinia childiae]